MAAVDLDVALLPDERCWGQGYGDRGYNEDDLAEIATNVGETHQPGYGPRLFAHTQGLEQGPDDWRVPAGFDATSHPNREYGPSDQMDPDLPTSDPAHWRVRPDLREAFRERGWSLDQHGRPCNPRAGQFLDDRRIGLNTGIGFSYFLGENVVVDAVVVAAGSIPLVRRQTDQGEIPSLPGGYSTPADYGVAISDWLSGHRPVDRSGIRATAERKLKAETGLVVPRGARTKIVRGIRPISSPHTLNFWTVTYTVRFDLAADELQLDPSKQAATIGLTELSGVLPRMWPDHRRALLGALGIAS